MTAHRALEVTQLAWGLKLTRSDGTVFAYTTHDEDATLSAVLYKSNPGFTASALRVPNDLSVANFQILGAIDDDNITAADLMAGLFDFASIELIEYVWSDLTITPSKLFKGRIGEVPKGTNQFQVTLAGLADALQDPIGQVVQPSCRHDFGDANCGADLGALAQTGTVSGVTSRRALAATGLTGAGNRAVTYTANTISFAPHAVGGATGVGDLILDSAAGFITAGFLVGDAIEIEGSGSNDTTHTIAALLAGKITTESQTVNKEAAGPSVTIIARTPGYFDGGRVTWLTGNNAGLSMEIKTWDGAGNLVLFLPMPYDIQIGDTFTATPGCDKRIPTCVSFGLILNFGGENTVPGQDAALTYPNGQ